jgi:hypothetical protein
MVRDCWIRSNNGYFSNMNFRLILPFLFIVLFSSFVGSKITASFAKAKIVGVYDRDSLQNEVPRFRIMKAAVETEKRQIDSNRVLMYENLAELRRNFARDSAKMSPAVKAIKLEEISDTRLNIAQFSQYANEHIKNLYQVMEHDFDNIFILTALNVQKQKGFDAVLDKKQLIAYKKQNASVKTRNVSKEMYAALDLK